MKNIPVVYGESDVNEMNLVFANFWGEFDHRKERVVVGQVCSDS